MSFGELSQNFVKSLQEHGADLRLEKFAVHDFRDQKQGRGLIALQDIEEDEVLFSIPRSLTLNIDSCSMNEDQKRILRTLGQWEPVIIIILYEKSLGAKSKWYHYFQVLPLEDSFNNLMFWEDSELEMLKPSLVLNRIGKDEAVEMYNRLFPAAIQELGIYEQLKDVTIDQFHRVASTIMSYSFDLESGRADDEDEEQEDEEEEDDDDEEVLKALVPLADTLNADTNLCNANLVYTPEALVMRSTSKISKGEQIYNIYSQHPNAEILRRYGYVEFTGAKQDMGELVYDDVLQFFTEEYEFPAKLINSIVEFLRDNEFLLELTVGQDIILDSYECYIDGFVEPEVMLFFQLFTALGLINKQDKKLIKRMPKSELEKFLNRNIKKNFQLIEQSKVMKSTVENLGKVIDRRLSQYPVDELKDASIEADYGSRSAMAKCVLQSEIRALIATKEKAFVSFEVVDDAKMIKNILKRKTEEEETKAAKKRRK